MLLAAHSRWSTVNSHVLGPWTHTRFDFDFIKITKGLNLSPLNVTARITLDLKLQPVVLILTDFAPHFSKVKGEEHKNNVGLVIIHNTISRILIHCNLLVHIMNPLCHYPFIADVILNSMCHSTGDNMVGFAGPSDTMIRIKRLILVSSGKWQQSSMAIIVMETMWPCWWCSTKTAWGSCVPCLLLELLHDICSCHRWQIISCLRSRNGSFPAVDICGINTILSTHCLNISRQRKLPQWLLSSLLTDEPISSSQHK